MKPCTCCGEPKCCWQTRAERAEAALAHLLEHAKALQPYLPQGEPFGAEKFSAHKKAAWAFHCAVEYARSVK